MKLALDCLLKHTTHPPGWGHPGFKGGTVATDFILLIEDHDDLRNLLALWLSRRGHAVVGVASIEAAEMVLAQARPWVVVLAYEPHGRSACGILPALKRPTAPPTIVTSTALIPERELLQQLGNFAGSVLKPADPGQFLALIEATAVPNEESWARPPDRSRKGSGTIRKVEPAADATREMGPLFHTGAG